MKTTAIPVSPLQSPSGSRLAARLPDFVTLMKPCVMALAVFTALVGMIIAPGHLDPLLGSIAVLAIAAGLAPPVSSIRGATPS
jgi:protoheme IX farnesyltransferase